MSHTAPKTLSDYRKDIDSALEDSFLRRTLDTFAVAYRANREAVFKEVDERGLIKQIADAKDDAAVQAADLVVYGCSTMGLGELQEDFIPYYENRMTPALLKGKNVAVFGLGDKENYEDYFCWAADILAKKVQACGANLVCDPLKVDGEPDDNRAAVAAWAQAL